MCAFFFPVASASVLLNCDLTEEGKAKFKASIQSKYGCSLSSDHTYVLHGAGKTFSSAWDDAVEACSKIYASQNECSAMIDSCEVVMEVATPLDYENNLRNLNLGGSCECLGPVQNQSVCSKVDDYHEAHGDVTTFIGSYALKNCRYDWDSADRKRNAFPINCNFDSLY